jgi:superkiller protein 3
LVKRQFSTATFDSITELDSSTAFSSLLGPIFALQKLQEQISSEPVSLRLNALFNERVQEFTPAAAKLEIVCNTVEQRYEETESEEDLIRYAQAKADLARVRLGLKEYEAAVENASLALDLSGDTEALKNCRLSAHLTAGLAHYYLGAMDDSLEMFKAALTESNENPDVVCLLSQVLWAKGGDEERDVARDQLFACIEKHPDHLQSTLLLGAIGVLDNNEDVVDAVMDDLQAVCGDDKIDEASREKVDKLLSLIGQLMVRLIFPFPRYFLLSF